MEGPDSYHASFTYSLFIDDVTSKLKTRRKFSEPTLGFTFKGETEMRGRCNSHLLDYKAVHQHTPSTIDNEEVNEDGGRRTRFSLKSFSLKNENFTSNLQLFKIVQSLECIKNPIMDTERVKAEFEENLVKELSELIN